MIGVSATHRRRINALKKIYDEIYAWGRDSESVARITSAVNPSADLVVVGEAIGPDTVRHSGVNYFRLDGRLGRTGRNLEEILRTVGLTLYPQKDVRLRSGTVIEGVPSGGVRTVYCTDLCPEYPGYAVSKGERPTQERIRDALRREFLARELMLIQPRAILLLGAEAHLAFSTYFLKRSRVPTLGRVVGNLASNVSTYRDALVIPFWHTSPASPAFQKWLKTFRRAPLENSLIRCIRKALVPR
jgi:uracil-DNA glycosylase